MLGHTAISYAQGSASQIAIASRSSGCLMKPKLSNTTVLRDLDESCLTRLRKSRTRFPRAMSLCRSRPSSTGHMENWKKTVGTDVDEWWACSRLT